ncbi:MAG: hypothetical protein ACYS5W_08245 [Planctomycetota bacterium]
MSRHLRLAIVCAVLLAGLLLSLDAIVVVATLRETPVGWRWVIANAPLFVVTLGCLGWHLRCWVKQQPPPPWGALRFLFQLCVLGWLFFVAVARPFHITKLELAAGMLVGLFAAGLLLRPLAVRSPTNVRVLRVLDIVILNICIIALGLELGLRLVSHIKPMPVLARAASNAELKVASSRPPGGHVRFGFPCNANGHYDSEFTPKQPGRPLILSIGDSFSAGVVPHRFHFTTKMERELPGVDVYNMGMPAIGPAEYALLWRTEGKQLRPDIVVINLFVGNDPLESRGYRGAHRWLRSWFEWGNVLLFVVPERILRIRQERDRLQDPERVPGQVPGEATDHVIADPAALLAAFPWVANPIKEPASMSLEAFLEIERKRAAGLLFPAPDMHAKFFEAMEDLWDALGDVPLMFTLIPDEFQVNDALWAQLAPRLPAGAGNPNRFSPQKPLRTWLDDRGIPYLDLLPILRGVPPMADGQRHLYQLQDTHFNVRGNDVAGKAIADFLRRRFAEALEQR